MEQKFSIENYMLFLLLRRTGEIFLYQQILAFLLHFVTIIHLQSEFCLYGAPECLEHCPEIG